MMCHRCFDYIRPGEPYISLEHGKYTVWAYHSEGCKDPYTETEYVLLKAHDLDALFQLKTSSWARTIEDVHLPEWQPQ